jgi:glycosyltransferase involved in cell wall biosynthesis
VAAARVVIADSNATRNDIYKFYGTPTEKIRTVYPGYNNQLFRPVRDSNEIARVRAQYGLTQPYLVSVGTLQPRKNYARLIEAFATLPDEVLLVIVGKKGWLFDSILARATNLGVAARVRFLDYVPLGDLPALYTGARAAILASLHEGFGFPALEAQACDTPLVCSNRAALPEVAGEGAAFVDPMNIAALVQALEAILRNEEWRTVLIERGRRNVERFAWNKTAHELAEIISGL